MEIYTGNFGNVKKYEKIGLFMISIANTSKYFYGTQFRELNPEWSTMKMNDKDFTAAFNDKLDRLNPKRIVSDIARLSQNKDVVLLCHEKEGDFCHRELVAKWLENTLGIEVKELGKMAPKKRRLPPQLSLF